MRLSILGALAALLPLFSASLVADEPPPLSPPAAAHPALKPMDIFELEYASDPRISPDGQRIVYVRNSYDVQTDRRVGRLWMIDLDSDTHRPLNEGEESEGSPRWSPDGARIAFLSGGQIHVKFLDSGQTMPVTHERESPGNIAWSPDGTSIAFTRRVAEEPRHWAKVPEPPKGAEWAEAAQVIDRLTYRIDGAGYVEGGYRHLFVVPAEGGTARQLTDGEFNHGGTPVWSPDSETLYITGNRHDDWEYQPDDEIYAVSLVDAEVTAVTTRRGPDESPAISPDGEWLAYLGHDEEFLGYQPSRLYLRRIGGEEVRVLATDLDRSIAAPRFTPDGDHIIFQYDDLGDTRIATVSIDGGAVETIADRVGGTTLGRPYASGSFDVGPAGRVVYPRTTPRSPGEIAMARVGETEPEVLTALNSDLLPHRALGRVEELWTDSSHDGRPIQGWLITPPDFDPERKYPLILEIHGGPFANYGPRFTAELQLYAAAGYVVLYTNPRGSTSYGREFGNLIHHAYPGNDYDDLMSCVDAVIARGFIDESHLFVTGGSGGGVLTAWIVGKTDRFRAAVVAKPVIHWASFVLTADFSAYFTKYWFPGFPWDHPEHYFARSPLSLVGNVVTPTMLLTGEEDYRTPISETEQYYKALKLRKIETAMVRIPDSSHSIASRPSNLIRKVGYILSWFEKHSELP